MSGSDERQRVKVSIGGFELQLAADVAEETVREVASFVDSRFSAIQGSSKGDTTRIALLTAMNVAGELFESRTEIESLKKRIAEFESAYRSMTERIDECL